MNRENPPRAARWMLEHLTPGENCEGLAGDLLEEYRAGRGAAWYWRQVLAALAIGFLRELRTRRAAVAFALLWGVPMPWLWLRWVRHAAQAGWMGRLWALPWPWSTIFGMAIGLVPEIIAVWMGMAAYLLLYLLIARPQRRPRIWRGMAVSAVAWWVLMMGVVVAPVHGGINTDTATVMTLLRDPVFLLMKLPQFVAVIVGIWVALPHEKPKAIAA